MAGQVCFPLHFQPFALCRHDTIDDEVLDVSEGFCGLLANWKGDMSGEHVRLIKLLLTQGISLTSHLGMRA